MYTKQVTIHNPSGLHARPASEFVSAAAKFKSRITIRKDEEGAREVNAKSIVMILSQALVTGTTVRITANGEDETVAVDSLVALIEGGFGE